MERCIVHLILHVDVDFTVVDEEVSGVVEAIFNCVVKWCLLHLVGLFKERSEVDHCKYSGQCDQEWWNVLWQ